MGATVTWRYLLDRWCKPRPAPAPPGLAAPLAAFLAAGGRAAFSNQNTFWPPEIEDGWLVFYVECQGCCKWAYRADDQDADPHVYVREIGGEYAPVGCRLDAFLSAAALTEAVFGSPSGRSGECDTDRLDDL